MLEKIIIEPNTPAQASVIFLHGLGANGDDLSPLVREFNFKQKDKIRFIFPHAKAIPITINNGYIMPGWFDIYSFNKDSKEDHQGIEASRLLINHLIEEEHSKGIEYHNICLAGFSQGGVIALDTALKFEHKLAGVIGLSCYLSRFDQNYAAANKDIKIFLGHGTADSVVDYSYGANAAERLKNLNYDVVLHKYQMAHSICSQEVSDIAGYFNECFELS